MVVSQTEAKKGYREIFLRQRSANLIFLRESIAKKTLTQFASCVGIQKSNLSDIEKGVRDLSLANLHAYRTYFLQEHNLEVSADFLLGYTDAVENGRMSAAHDLGLSNAALDTIKSLDPSQKDVLDKLSHDNMLRFLLIEMWRYATGSSFVNIRIENIISGSTEVVDDRREVDQLMKAAALNSFNMILNSLKTKYEPEMFALADSTIKELKRELDE